MKTKTLSESPVVADHRDRDRDVERDLGGGDAALERPGAQQDREDERRRRRSPPRPRRAGATHRARLGAELPVHGRGAAEQHRDRREPEERQPDELAVEASPVGRVRPGRGRLVDERRSRTGHGAAYLMLPAMLKIGRYIAMRKPPTMPPRKTIMTGSIMLVSAPTATSTSSS